MTNLDLIECLSVETEYESKKSIGEYFIVIFPPGSSRVITGTKPFTNN